MRPILPTDLDWSVRALLAVSDSEWPNVMAEMLGEADCANRYRKRTGKMLAGQGGSLMDAALKRARKGGLRYCDHHYCAALAATLEGVELWRHTAHQSQAFGG